MKEQRPILVDRYCSSYFLLHVRSQVGGIFQERKHGRGPVSPRQPLTRSGRATILLSDQWKVTRRLIHAGDAETEVYDMARAILDQSTPGD